jgi:hypothetical protein
MSPVIVASAAVVVVWAQVESRWVHPDRQQLADVNGLHFGAAGASAEERPDAHESERVAARGVHIAPQHG